jgi:hypothetical protein
MTTEELCIWALESELRKAGHFCSHSGVTLGFPSLALEFRALEANSRRVASNFALTVTFEASSQGPTTPGIRILAVGLAKQNPPPRRKPPGDGC